MVDIEADHPPLGIEVGVEAISYFAHFHACAGAQLDVKTRSPGNSAASWRLLGEPTAQARRQLRVDQAAATTR